MKINNRLLDIVLAKKRISLTILRESGVSPQTLTRVRKGVNVMPATVGKIAEALGVDVTEIIDQEEKQ